MQITFCHRKNIITLVSFHPEMVLFYYFVVNLRGWLCVVPSYISAQPLDFLELVKNYSFLNWKQCSVHTSFLDGL